jgi:thiol-disulfide isomerase/thioredoxin
VRLHRYAFLIGLLLTVFFVPLGKVLAEPVPNLPAEWRNTHGSRKLILLDFYSDYCGTCQMMTPHIHRLQKLYGSQLSIRHINTDGPELSAIGADYHLRGTPTYILYSPDGQPVYRMTDMISPAILFGQVGRATGQLKRLDATASLPKPLAGQENSWGNLILLVFENTKTCPQCAQSRPQLNAMAQAGAASGLKIVYLDTDALPAWAEKLRPHKLPLYLLVDNAQKQHQPNVTPDYGILLNVNEPVDPAILWQSIQVLSRNGL